MTAQVRRVLGTMSGTSLDGVDAAVIDTDGRRIMAFGPSAYRAYSRAEQAVLRRALGLWPGDPRVDEAARVVEAAHQDLIVRLVARAGPVALVGFHGQTLAHDPGGRGTHQAGDGARLARRIGHAVAWDFRSADVAAGGQGAPLAPVFHAALADHVGAERPVAVLNLGGVGNLTLVDPRLPVGMPGALVAFDTGPANAPLDDLMQRRLGRTRDNGGRLAAIGTPDGAILDRFAADPWFRQAPPKSLDRNAFAWLLEATADLAAPDALATLVQAAARAVALGLRQMPQPASALLVAGGGRHNHTLMAAIAAETGLDPQPVDALGLDGDMIEAQAFAFLAARTYEGLPISFPETTGVLVPMAGGRLSHPGLTH